MQDLCCDQLPVEARAGVLMKLDPFIKRGMKESDVKDWIEWQYKYFNIDGAQYGIGKYMGTTALYYNKEWFQQKGVAFPDDTWDWNKYRDAMIKLTDIPNKKWGINLLGHLGTVGQSMSPDRRQAKVHQNGGNMVDPKNDLKSALDTPKTIEAFEWIHARIWKDNASIQPQQLPGFPDNILDHPPAVRPGAHRHVGGRLLGARPSDPGQAQLRVGRGDPPQGPGGAQRPGHHGWLVDVGPDEERGRRLAALLLV